MFLKGIKCHTRCLLDKRSAPAGRRTTVRRAKVSEYGLRLKEKQLARKMSGLNEIPFKNLFAKATKTRGKTGETLLRFLETRLDNIVRRLGFAVSLKAARQLVSHGHFSVNGKGVNIPSYQVKPGDKVSLNPKISQILLVRQGLEEMEKRGLRPSFLEYDAQTLTGKLLRWPDRAEMSYPVKDQLLVEYYSK